MREKINKRQQFSTAISGRFQWISATILLYFPHEKIDNSSSHLNHNVNHMRLMDSIVVFGPGLMDSIRPRLCSLRLQMWWTHELILKKNKFPNLFVPKNVSYFAELYEHYKNKSESTKSFEMQSSHSFEIQNNIFWCVARISQDAKGEETIDRMRSCSFMRWL